MAALDLTLLINYDQNSVNIWTFAWLMHIT